MRRPLHRYDWDELFQLEFPGHALGQLVVQPPVGIFGPGIEAPIRDSYRVGRLFAANENGPRIARPHTVGPPQMEPDILRADSSTFEDRTGSRSLSAVLDNDVHLFHAA